MNNKGFTLIEVIATVIILSLIALIAYPTLTNTLKKNKDMQIENFKESAELAADTYIRLYQDEVLGMDYYANTQTNYMIRLDKEPYEKVLVNDLIKAGLLEKPNFEYDKYQYDEVICGADDGVAKCKYKDIDIDSNKEYIYKGKTYTIKGEDYIVLNSSFKDDDYVSLIKKDPLTLEQIESLGYEAENVNYSKVDTIRYDQVEVKQVAVVPFCSNNICNYRNSYIKQIVDDWAENEFNNTLINVDINGIEYSARLAQYKELRSINTFIVHFTAIPPKTNYVISDFNANNDYNYWLMDGPKDYNNIIWNVYRYYDSQDDKDVSFILYGRLDDESASISRTKSQIRPVINYNKDNLNELLNN